MLFAATCMDIEVIVLSEVSQTQKDKYHMMSLIYGIQNKEKDTNELIYKTEIDPQTQKTNLWLPKRKGMGEG